MIKNQARKYLHISRQEVCPKSAPSKWNKLVSITVTSLPDDYVHYCQPRILTVREWARLQTFPDSYIFKGPGPPVGDVGRGP